MFFGATHFFAPALRLIFFLKLGGRIGGHNIGMNQYQGFERLITLKRGVTKSSEHNGQVKG